MSHIQCQPQEQRNHRRYVCSAEVIVSWTGADGSALQERGRSENISPFGVALIARADLRVGTRVKLSLYIPPSTAVGRFSELYGDGVVVRVQPLVDTQNRIAAEVVFREGLPLHLRSSLIQ